jgi:hypothetical protein
MKEKDINATAGALNDALRKSILKKLDTIRESIVLQKGANQSSYYQMLMMIDDDLDDVLLNWEYDQISPILSSNREDELDDLDDEEDYDY